MDISSCLSLSQLSVRHFVGQNKFDLDVKLQIAYLELCDIKKQFLNYIFFVKLIPNKFAFTE